MAIVNELITKFSYQGSTAPIADYTKSLDGAFAALTKITAVAGVAVAAMGAMVLRTADHADALGDLSQRTGIATDTIQELGYVAQLNGSSFEAMESSLEGLNRQIGLAASGGTAQMEVFKELGISIKDSSGNIKSSDVILVEMQQRMKALGYGTQQTAGILRQLRLDPTLSQTLNLSAEEMANFTKEARDAGLISKEQIEAAGEFNDNLDRMKFRLMAVGNQMMLNLMPAMSRMMEIIERTIGFIRGFIDGIIHIGKSIYTAIDSTIGFENAMYMVGAAMLWLGRSAIASLIVQVAKLGLALLMNPLFWIAAVIVGVILVVDDLVTAFAGGESVIGDFFAGFNIDIVNTLINGFNFLKQTIAALMLPIDGVLLAIYSLSKAAADFMNMFGADIDTKGIEASIRRVDALAKEHMMTAQGQANMTAGRAAYVPSAPSPKGGAAGSPTNVSNTVTITGVSDPKEAARLTGNELQKQNRAAVTQRGNGGR